MRSDRCRDLVRVALLVLGTTGVADRSARAQESISDWRRLVGCYRRGDAQVALDSLPARFVFEKPVPLAHKAWGYPRSSADMFWRLLPGDTVELTSGNGLYGAVYRLTLRGASLVGVVGGWTDVVPSKMRPERVRAHRESCSPDGRGDEPPPNADSLKQGLAPAVAKAIADSVLPRLAGPVGTRNDGYRWGWSVAVDSILRLDERMRAARDPTYGTWIMAGEFHESRDSASAVVSVTQCLRHDAPNFSMSRTRYDFARVGSRWTLASTRRIGITTGSCGPAGSVQHDVDRHDVQDRRSH